MVVVVVVTFFGGACLTPFPAGLPGFPIPVLLGLYSGTFPTTGNGGKRGSESTLNGCRVEGGATGGRAEAESITSSKSKLSKLPASP